MGMDEIGINSSYTNKMQWSGEEVNGRAHQASGKNSRWNIWPQTSVKYGAVAVELDWIVNFWKGVYQLQRVGRVRMAHRACSNYL